MGTSFPFRENRDGDLEWGFRGYLFRHAALRSDTK
jgi:hypothetical protein